MKKKKKEKEREKEGGGERELSIATQAVRRGLINTEIRSGSRIGNYWRGVAGKVNPRKAPALSGRWYEIEKEKER